MSTPEILIGIAPVVGIIGFILTIILNKKDKREKGE